jgi:hypothetical protein
MAPILIARLRPQFENSYPSDLHRQKILAVVASDRLLSTSRLPIAVIDKEIE